jgi:hypothetical protein
MEDVMPNRRINVAFRMALIGLLALLLSGATASPIAAAEAAAAGPPVREPLHIFLLIGQSNMAGRGKIEEQDRKVHPHVWKLDQANQWVPATDPLHFDKPRIAGVSLGSTFGRIIADRNENIQVGLVPCAVGGTRIDQWAKGGKLYTNAIARARIAMQRGELKGILWHQGEGDCGSQAKLDAYFPKLTQLVREIRGDLNAPVTLFIAGQLSRAWGDEKPVRKEFNIRLNRYSRHQTSPYFAAVLSENVSTKSDKTHFDAAGLRELGKRYADAWSAMAVHSSKRDPAVAPQAIRFNGHPVSQAVSIMAERGAIRYSVDADVLAAPIWSQLFSAEFRNVPAKRALQGALRQLGLTMMMEEPAGGVYRIAFRKP